jgi:Thioesterase-like superfamily
MADSFYVPDGDAFVSTELTRGPWDAKSQHAGPPAALVAREIERLPVDDGQRQVGRLTYEILRPVPIAPLTVSARIARPGRRVELAEASLVTTSGEELVRARAWRLRRSKVDVPASLTGEGGSGEPGTLASILRPGLAPPGPEDGEQRAFFDTGHDVGYHTAMEYRFIEGAFMEAGPAIVWMRMGVPLLPDEDPTPLQRVLAAADSGNGVSAALDYQRWRFVNADLTVYLLRPPTGEWVALEAATTATAGIGLADTALHDQQGPIGRSTQALFVDRR